MGNKKSLSDKLNELAKTHPLLPDVEHERLTEDVEKLYDDKQEIVELRQKIYDAIEKLEVQGKKIKIDRPFALKAMRNPPQFADVPEKGRLDTE